MGIARFFFRKRWTPPKQPRPKWLNALLLIFIVYAVAVGVHKSPDGTPSDLGKDIQKVGQAVSRDNIERTYNSYRNILFPVYDSSLEMRDVAVGKGTPAICGQEVSIAYATQVVNGRMLPFKADRTEPLTFRIGAGKVIPAIEQGVTGMKIGGKRSLASSPGMAYGNKAFSDGKETFEDKDRIRIDVELLGAKPEVPDVGKTPYRISNNYGKAVGYAILCGQQARVHVTIWDVEGNKLYSTKDKKAPVSFTVGKSEVFLGLEQGVVGLPRKGQRTLVVPPEYQKTMNGNPPAITFPFPKAQTVLVDVEALP